jgi:hypothetical protein
MNTGTKMTAAMVRQRKRESKSKREAALATLGPMERTRVPITGLPRLCLAPDL